MIYYISYKTISSKIFMMFLVSSSLPPFAYLQVLFGSRLYESEFQELILILMVPCVVDEILQNSVYKPSSWNLNCAIKNVKMFSSWKIRNIILCNYHTQVTV